ncbi:hypothetical protein [Yinghuangia aomiensis]|uniref:hypothetical protein n=1 Tax=Yinghuangia aomiensis TaxID=676205 RepID=UPI0031E5FDA1
MAQRTVAGAAVVDMSAVMNMSSIKSDDPTRPKRRRRAIGYTKAPATMISQVTGAFVECFAGMNSL